MAVVVAGVHPVRVHCRQILDLKLDQTLGEVLREAEIHSELVGLELKLAGEDVHEEFDDGVHGGESVGEEDEADDDGVLIVEAEGVVKRGIVDEDGEKGEDVEDVELEGQWRTTQEQGGCT